MSDTPSEIFRDMLDRMEYHSLDPDLHGMLINDALAEILQRTAEDMRDRVKSGS